eukprot:GHRQ01015350.1.p2 GENE.GHRQ01015350.1~~GHRQ01015350.1.p2  ORF type:complete len:119 (+),score=33.11 GHRQ01015350.1:723-1079(+)
MQAMARAVLSVAFYWQTSSRGGAADVVSKHLVAGAAPACVRPADWQGRAQHAKLLPLLVLQLQVVEADAIHLHQGPVVGAAAHTYWAPSTHSNQCMPALDMQRYLFQVVYVLHHPLPL